MRRTLWFAALVACAVFPAAAGDYLVGGSAGQANISIDGGGFDESDTGFKLFGGWRMMQHFGLEGGYVDFGDPSMSAAGVSAEAQVSAWDAFATGVIPLGQSWELFGKAGLVFWDADARVSTGPISVSESDSGTDLAYGGGAAYKVGEKFAIRFEWEIFNLDGADVNMVSGGFDYRF